MAVRLVSNEVSDLCIGKPGLRTLPQSAITIGEALIALRRSGERQLGVLGEGGDVPEKKAVSGKISVADIICYLCSDGNLASPAAALERPVSALLSEDAVFVWHVEPHSGLLEAVDLILDGAQNLVVPIRYAGRRKVHSSGGGGASDFCWLTHEDFVRYLLNSIALFSHIAAVSIDALGLVRPANAHSLRSNEPGLSILPLIRRALSDQAAVAVVTDNGRLLGEISPSALSACDATLTVAAAIATLTASDLMVFIDYYGSPPEYLVRAIKARLKEQGLQEMLELIEDELSSYSNSSSPSTTSSSSDEESSGGKRLRRVKSRSLSTARRSEEPEVCYPGSSLVAVMAQALAHRVSYLWVVDEDNYGLIGIVNFSDMLRVLREQLLP
ncbi:CBS domain-containing protein CBSX5-like [Curcuma longa]|uniref:CBS domain-containing protein CBSX5-like n=1 Tax=Curcuma longa TaxID=136217 RepID=UPI003D9EE68C